MQDFVFNNLLCDFVSASKSPRSASGLSPPQYAIAKIPDQGKNTTSSLILEYAPIVFVTLPKGYFASSFTQFLVRCEPLNSVILVNDGSLELFIGFFGN